MRHLRYTTIVLLFVVNWLGVLPLRAVDVPEANPGDMMPRLFAATVAVRVYDAAQHLCAEGGGCFVTLSQPHGDPLCGVVTCRHLCAGAARVELQTLEGMTIPVNNVLAEDSDSDLVLLAAPLPSGVTAITAAANLPLDKTPFWLVTPAQTVLKGTLTEREAAAFAELTCPVAPAFVGSPLVNARGALLGVAAPALREGTQSARLAIPAWRVCALQRAATHPLAAWAAQVPARWLPSAEGQFYQLRGWLAVGATDQAIAHLETLALIEQETTEVQLYRGICQYEADDDDDALLTLRKVCATSPTCAAAQTYLGATYLQLDRAAEALAPLTEAVRLTPDDEFALANLGECLVSLKRYTEALTPLQAAVRLKPDDAWAQTQLGGAYFNLSRSEESLAPLQAVVRLQPNEAWGHSILGATYVGLERYTEALPELKEALRLDPNDLYARFNYNLASNLVQLQPQIQHANDALDGMQQAIDGLLKIL